MTYVLTTDTASEPLATLTDAQRRAARALVSRQTHHDVPLLVARLIDSLARQQAGPDNYQPTPLLSSGDGLTKMGLLHVTTVKW